MNIVTPIPNSFGFPTSNVGTDSARRDNVLREAIPSVTQGEKSAAEKGLGSEADRNNQANNLANLLQNPTYDRPSVNQALINQNAGDANKDNGSDQSAGRENAESEQEKQQRQSEEKQIKELKERDTEVRLHEQAHAATGGQYAGAPSYEYETGPDGKRYAVGGEVSIDISEEKTAEQTVRKMQQVQAAALAPAEPSAQDYKVAAQAAQKEQAARADIAEEKLDKQNGNPNEAADQSTGESATVNEVKGSSSAPADAGPSKVSLELSEKTLKASETISKLYQQNANLYSNQALELNIFA
ncbi:hypothetical protein ISG33_13465 [Glaciecola sp. MH2013]|uniref:putative metalloprotease CJM1_0395 family protein n=1 Tax=Glaciecola sp. MH2013 TaxID=2785524 RepID=UPI00189D0667|nr:putative metalloprotease CJM1_0395 family protein [Glaciecola sp. MH2013]MBF7074409.1 hypothetical protein [Glaciecola sp. MH2013]